MGGQNGPKNLSIMKANMKMRQHDAESNILKNRIQNQIGDQNVKCKLKFFLLLILGIACIGQLNETKMIV